MLASQRESAMEHVQIAAIPSAPTALGVTGLQTVCLRPELLRDLPRGLLP